MRKLSMYNSISLDGYFTDSTGDMSWAHHADPEWNDYVAGNVSGQSEMLFGRVTYDMMSSFWPSPQALQMMPAVAKKMNESKKFVFSRTLADAKWQNTTLVKNDIAGAVRKLKEASGPDLIIMGSGTIVAQLAQAQLIDLYQLVVNPVILGGGRSLFEGVKDRLKLRAAKNQSFSNGNTVLWYEKDE